VVRLLVILLLEVRDLLLDGLLIDLYYFLPELVAAEGRVLGINASKE